MAAPEVMVRTNESPHLRVRKRLRELLRHREVLVNLTRKELKVKYKSSVLGILWSTVNPLMYLLIFYLVFTYVLPSGIPDFAVYLLSGLLAWTLFSTSLAAATGSIVNNASLVTKVAFPREILPLATIGSSLTNFFFQLGVLVAVMILFGYPALGPNLLLLPLALLVLLLFTSAMALLTSALNVNFRDTAHLVEIALLVWFWMTPIIYPAQTVLDRGLLVFRIYQLNPMVQITLGFQRALYGGTFPDGRGVLPDQPLSWFATRLSLVGIGSVVLLYLTWRLFYRRSGDFAEQL